MIDLIVFGLVAVVASAAWAYARIFARITAWKQTKEPTNDR